MSVSFPFTTLEEFLFWEDRPAYPWSCFNRLFFRGQLDRAKFEDVVRAVLQRHPLLRAKARLRGRTHLEWVVEDPRPVIVWETGPVGGPFPPATHLDLLGETGIRFRVVSDGRDSDLVIQFHHACSDGIGMFRFIHELLIAYAIACGQTGEGLRLPPPDADRLARRGTFGLTFGKLLRMLPKQAVGLLGVRQFLMRSATPIVPYEPGQDNDPPSPQYPTILTKTLDTSRSAALLQTAARLGVRLNDLLAAGLFLALIEWRSANPIPNDAWLRMMVPVSLRTEADRATPAASLASLVFLDRRPLDCADLLRSVHDEMSLILSHRLGLTFVFFSWLLNLVPGGLRRRSRDRRCAMSCILSNVGRIYVDSPLPRQEGNLVAGNVKLMSFDSIAPIRPHTCACFAVTTYADRLSITLHYDPRPLTGDQAAGLLATFLRRLQDLQTGVPPGGDPGGTVRTARSAY